MKVAIVHYWLVTWRGGEKVVEAFAEMFPEADIYTHVLDPEVVKGTGLEHRRIFTTFINRLPFAKKRYQNYLPLMPMALERLDLRDYDLVISSESGPAKGVIVRPDAYHVCYCHSPMRYLWDMRHDYEQGASWIKRMAMLLLFPRLRDYDRLSSMGVDAFVANSSWVGKRIEKYYRRESHVIAPPVDVDSFHISETIGDYYLMVGQLTRYKRVDLAVEAFNELGLPLVVIGEGEETAALRKMARGNIHFMGRQPFSVIQKHYAECKALIFPGVEDFGMVPVEAMASGRPVIAFRKGGACESVVEDVTGIFFDQPTAESLMAAVKRFQAMEGSFVPATLRKHAQTFGKRNFLDRFRQFLAERCGHVESSPSA
ncbi:MAG TPA: glycosyltransferase [Xanthomonadaceae bacterium]|jgi:glycosyltransferase involved in cell wall biosynthesis